MSSAITGESGMVIVAGWSVTESTPKSLIPIMPPVFASEMAHGCGPYWILLDQIEFLKVRVIACGDFRIYQLE